MSSETFTQINELLEQLDSNELKQVKAKVAYLEKQDRTSSPERATHKQKEEGDLELLYQGMKRELERRGLPVPTWYAFKQTDNYRLLKRSYDQCQEFFSQHFPTKRTERIWAYSLAIKLLADWLQYLNAPISVGTISRNVHNIPGRLDAAFPGYIESNLLSIALQPKKG